MSKIEEVARAIDPEAFDLPRDTRGASQKWRNRTSKARAQARAAIEAMREPTDAMMKAGELPGWDDSVSIGLSSDVWRAMIGAALSEVKG